MNFNKTKVRSTSKNKYDNGQFLFKTKIIIKSFLSKAHKFKEFLPENAFYKILKIIAIVTGVLIKK